MAFGKTAAIGGLGRLGGRALLVGLIAVLVASTAIVLTGGSVSAECEEGQSQKYCGPYVPDPKPAPDQPTYGDIINDLIFGFLSPFTDMLGFDDAVDAVWEDIQDTRNSPPLCVDFYCW